jgi:solute carrier family 39 (zinc transporter), member 1/2/3
MVSVFVVVGVEMFFAMRGAGHIHNSDFDKLAMEEEETVPSHGHHTHETRTRSERSVSFKRRPPELLIPHRTSTEHLIAGRSPSMSGGTPSPLPPSEPFHPAPHRRSHDSNSSDDELELHELNPAQGDGLLNGNGNHKPTVDETNAGLDEFTPPPTRPDRKALLQCLLLEAGILFHSIFIGMALSVTPAPGFYVLLVAISFHQTFEGLALGSRIAALTFHPRSPHPWLMALAYGTTTPFGQAVGLAIHSMYDPASQTGLLSVGVMNAISSGLLLFAGLVELLAADFLSEESYQVLRGKKRYQACGSVVCGAMLMALVGVWA